MMKSKQRFGNNASSKFTNVLLTLLLLILRPLSDDQLVLIKNMNFSFNLYSPSVLSNLFVAH